MRRPIYIIIGLLVLAGASEAAAESAARSPSTPRSGRQSISMSHLDPGVRICRRVVYTGSRLGKTKVCKTRSEWEALSRQAITVTERMQRNTKPH